MASVTLSPLAAARLPRRCCAVSGQPADGTVTVSAARSFPSWAVALLFVPFGLVVLLVMASSGAVRFEVPMARAARRRRGVALAGIAVCGLALPVGLIGLAILPSVATAVVSGVATVGLVPATRAYLASSVSARQRNGAVVLQRVHPAFVESLTPSGVVPQGWYADPGGGAGLRWWDGTQWTEHLHGAPC
jgi:MFS family permease